MSVLKQRLHRKNSAGVYDVVRLETSSDLVIRPDGSTIETALVSMKNDIDAKAASNHTHTAAAVGALPTTGGTMTGAIKFSTSSGWGGAVVDVRDGGASHGAALLLGAGGLTIIGGGESASGLFGALGIAGSEEQMHIGSDTTIYLHTNCQTVANRKTVTISTAGAITAPGGFSGNATTATKLATARTIRTNLASGTAVSFDGSANVTPGITGTLPVANGGTGVTSLSALKTALGIGGVSNFKAGTFAVTGTTSGVTNPSRNIGVTGQVGIIFAQNIVAGSLLNIYLITTSTKFNSGALRPAYLNGTNLVFQTPAIVNSTITTSGQYGTTYWDYLVFY